jgi:hypothetical protein
VRPGGQQAVVGGHPGVGGQGVELVESCGWAVHHGHGDGLAARAAGVPMAAAGLGASTAGPITVGAFAIGTLSCAFWGTVLAVLLARYTARPARTYLRATVALTALSLAGPLAAADTATSTKLMLAVAHLQVAAIVIPTVAARLRTAPGRHQRR